MTGTPDCCSQRHSQSIDRTQLAKYHRVIDEETRGSKDITHSDTYYEENEDHKNPAKCIAEDQWKRHMEKIHGRGMYVHVHVLL